MKFCSLFLLTAPILAADPLCLQEAIQQSLNHSFEVQEAESDIHVSYGEWIEAGAFPNPVFSIDWGSFGLFNNTNDCDDESISYELEQLVELGGKRGARQCLAEAIQRKTGYESWLIQFNVIAEVKKKYYLASKLIEEHYNGLRKKEIVKEILQILEERLASGTISPQVFYSSAKDLQLFPFECDEHTMELTETLGELEVLLGCSCLSCAQFEALPKEFSPPVEQCVNFECLPAYLVKEVAVEAAEKLYLLEEANSIPDIAIRFGVEQDYRKNHAAIGVGASIELPIFNRNEGNRAKAWALWQKAEIEKEHFRCSYEKLIKSAYVKAFKKHNQVYYYQEKILNPTRKYFVDYQEKQSQGNAEQKSLLEAELSVLEAQETFNNLVYEYLEALVEYERLISTCNE